MSKQEMGRGVVLCGPLVLEVHGVRAGAGGPRLLLALGKGVRVGGAADGAL